MNRYLILTLLICSLAYSQIPDFTHYEEMEYFNDTGYTGSITFVDWDDDQLTDILWVDNKKNAAGSIFLFSNAELRFLKNTGTATNPVYTDMGHVRHDNGDSLSYYHGWCGGIVDPRVGDLNNDGMDDLVFGTETRDILIFLKNRDGTVTLYSTLKSNVYEGRTTADLVDFNGDGLLDIVVSRHQYSTTGFDNVVYNYVILNEGTKEEPIFNSDNMFELKINGTPNKFRCRNILFTDLNNDNKKDLLFFNRNPMLAIELYYSLNVSKNDSIILGPIYDLVLNGEQVVLYKAGSNAGSQAGPNALYKVTTASGNKVHLAYHDANNDGIKEFYVNSNTPNAGWYRFYTEGAVNTSSKSNTKHGLSADVKLIGNRIILKNYNPATELCVFNLKGRLIKSQILSNNYKDEVTLKGLSSGAYYIQLKGENYNHVFNLTEIK